MFPRKRNLLTGKEQRELASFLDVDSMWRNVVNEIFDNEETKKRILDYIEKSGNISGRGLEFLNIFQTMNAGKKMKLGEFLEVCEKKEIYVVEDALNAGKQEKENSDPHS